MIDLFKTITTSGNQTITIIYDSLFDYDKYLLYLIYDEIRKNGFQVKIKHIEGHYSPHNPQKLIENRKNSVNICLKRFSHSFSDNIYGNVPSEALYISSYVLLFRNNKIKVIKSRTKDYNKEIKISQFIRLIKINNINEKEIR